MICIYHNRDLDGFASGAIVKHKYPDCKLIGWDYGETIPNLHHDEEIILIDISFPMHEMLRISSTNNLTWIDHHISAINEYRSGEKFCNDVLQDGIAACEIGWNYFFPNKDMPKAIKILGMYDTWRKNGTDYWNEVILPFQMGMRLKCTSPETFPIELFEYDNLRDPIFSVGDVIMQYQKVQNELAIKGKSFHYEFQGLRAIVCNAGGGSILFDSIWNPEDYDIMITFSYCKNKWIYSLYTTHEYVDCSAIAKSNGGGGHRKAAGFESNKFLFV